MSWVYGHEFHQAVAAALVDVIFVGPAIGIKAQDVGGHIPGEVGVDDQGIRCRQRGQIADHLIGAQAHLCGVLGEETQVRHIGVHVDDDGQRVFARLAEGLVGKIGGVV